MKRSRHFPPLAAFHSHLTGQLTCTEEQYEAEKQEFNRRRALPRTHPDHYRNMVDYLRVSFFISLTISKI